MPDSKRLIRRLGQEWRWILAGLFATAGMGLAEILTGGMLKVIIDMGPRLTRAFEPGGQLPVQVKLPIKIAGGQKVELFSTKLSGEESILHGIILLCLTFLAIYLLKEFFRYLRDVSLDSAVQRLMRSFKEEVCRKTLHLPIAFFDRTPTGELVSRITYDVARLEGVILLIVEFMRAGVALLLFVPVLFYINWPIACFAMLYYPLAFWVMHRLNQRIGKTSTATTENVADYTAFLEDRLNSIASIRAFGREEKESRNFGNLVTHNLKLNLRLIRLKHILKPVCDVQSMVGICLMFLLFALLARTGLAAKSLGSAALFLYLASQSYKPIKKVAQSMAELHITLASSDKIYSLLDETPCPTVSSPPAKTAPPIESIEFKNVSFSYAPERPILKNVSFKAIRGDTVALSGPSGSGKTTITKLLMGFYQPTAGEILINGQPMTPTLIAQFRPRIAGVSNDLRLLNASVSDNLAPIDDIPDTHTQLLQRAAADLDSELGPNAEQVSTGQRTMLKFIRALLRQPDLLIIDDAFAPLDSETESFVRTMFSPTSIKVVASCTGEKEAIHTVALKSPNQ